MQKQLVQIPKIFYSYESKAPFTSCINCNKLLDEHTDYVIEKAMRRYPGFQAVDTIFDYAMCMDCALSMRDELSIESRKCMDEFFQPYMMTLHRHIMSGNLEDVETAISKCLVTGQSIEEVQEYQIYAFCRGNYLNKSMPTYMVSEKAIEKVLPLLSNETRDFLNGFFDKHFSPDPSLMEPIGPKLILV